MNENYPQYLQKNRHLRQESRSFALILEKSSCHRWFWVILSRLFKNSHIKRYLYIFQCIEPTSINESNQKRNLWKLSLREEINANYVGHVLQLNWHFHQTHLSHFLNHLIVLRNVFKYESCAKCDYIKHNLLWTWKKDPYVWSLS